MRGRSDYAPTIGEETEGSNYKYCSIGDCELLRGPGRDVTGDWLAPRRGWSPHRAVGRGGSPSDADLAEAFEVSVVTIDNWKIKYSEFLGSLKASKEVADNRVERSLYARATGYSYDAVKIFCTKDGKITKVPYTVQDGR